jgi:hypothetical protein
MKQCTNCGVELDVEMNYCPLCGQKSNAPVVPGHKEQFNKDSMDAEVESYAFEELTPLQKGKIFWELSTIILVSGVVVSLFIDLLVNKQVSWSKYSITIGMFLFVNISLITFLQRSVYLLLLGSYVSTSLLLLLLDLFSKNLGWGLKLGIPIIFFCYFIISLIVIIIKKSKQKGVNIIAYSLVAAGILCLCIDGIITLHRYNLFKLQWSMIVMISVLPVAGILLFIHYRLKKVTNLKRFFHI